jgi:hypothetical protein
MVVSRSLVIGRQWVEWVTAERSHLDDATPLAVGQEHRAWLEQSHGVGPGPQAIVCRADDGRSEPATRQCVDR